MVVRSVILCGLIALMSAAVAQPYPTRPVRFIVPFAPGGGGDILARFIAPRLTDAWGQQVVIDNRGGAGTILGTEAAARAVPDGHTLLLVTNQLATNPSLYKQLPYDSVKDFTPVTRIATIPLVLVATPSIAVTSVPQIIAIAKAKPDQFNMASSGNASPSHLAGELFKAMADVHIVHVPYKGSGTALPALIGGQVQLMFATMPSALPHVRAGRLHGIAVTTVKRSDMAPDLPAIADAVPGFEVTGWYGLVVPAKTPKALVHRLNSDIRTILANSDFRKRLVTEGAVPDGSTPEEFGAFITAEEKKWAHVIKVSGARID